jgi:preprotein translocase subunit SecA
MSNSAVTFQSIVGNLYPEREEPRLGKLEQWVARLEGRFAGIWRPRPERFAWIIEGARSQGRSMEDWSDEKILETSRELRVRLRSEGSARDPVAQAFALVCESARRTLNMPHFDVQLIGGLVLLGGMVAEMDTGEGKTLVATLPACVSALAGVPVHIVTVNDYLATRDADWMRPVYSALGLRVGTIVHGMDPGGRREAYRCDITYCTNKELAFDYLRDRIVLWDRPSALRLQIERLQGETSRVSRLLLRGLHFAIVDEADSVLIDEARTPLIISSEAEGVQDQGFYPYAMGIARDLVPKEEYTVSTGERTVELTDRGRSRIRDFPWAEEGLGINEAQREELVRQALVALHLFSRDKHYLVKDGKIQIIDEYTGRLMADRSWERGLHQLVEIKEGCEVTQRKETKAKISYQRFFRRYLRLAGMTGTAREVAGELRSIYRLKVVTIPTHRPTRRQLLPDRIYSRADQKWEAVLKRVSDIHRQGRPVLIGTRSVETSEHLSGLMTRAGLPHRVLNARQDKEEAEIIAEAGQEGRITVATNMAGRGTDIRLGAGIAQKEGLHVMATERHEAGRIDRQLFGRCGRQGDPGTSEAWVSLEDELISAYVGRTIRWAAAVALRKGDGFAARWIGKVLFEMAQRHAERLHARMRRDLLRVDEQVSESLAFTGKTE